MDFQHLWKPVAWLIVTVFSFFVARYLLNKQQLWGQANKVVRQFTYAGIILSGIIAILISLESSREADEDSVKLIEIFGLVMTIALTLGSANFIGNAMSGLLNKVIRGYNHGDYIQINEFFGQITDRSMFHIEIQTENSNLIVLPHQFLSTNPVKIIRASKTLISAEVALAYHIHRLKVEGILIQAALDARLRDPVVMIKALGEHSISYEVVGELTEVRKGLLSTRSRLYANMLDYLHEADIEIAAPTAEISQRTGGERLIPDPVEAIEKSEIEVSLEHLAFDKGTLAKLRTTYYEKLRSILQELKECEAEIKAAETDEERSELEKKRERIEKRRDSAREQIIKVKGDLKSVE